MNIREPPNFFVVVVFFFGGVGEDLEVDLTTLAENFYEMMDIMLFICKFR